MAGARLFDVLQGDHQQDKDDPEGIKTCADGITRYLDNKHRGLQMKKPARGGLLAQKNRLSAAFCGMKKAGSKTPAFQTDTSRLWEK